MDPPTFSLRVLHLLLFLLSTVHSNETTTTTTITIPTTSSSSFSRDRTPLVQKTHDLQTGPAIVAVLAILSGTLVCLAGYRLFRPAVFLCAFLTGGLFVAGLVETALASLSWMPTAFWIGFFTGGSLAGILTLVLYRTSIFLAGAVGGVVLACTLTTSIGAQVYPRNPDVVLVVVALGLGILGGFLALRLEKPVLVTTTALVGAALCVSGVGYFAGNYTTGVNLRQYRVKNHQDEWVYAIPAARWVYLSGFVLLFIVGMCVQIKKTARGYDHRGSTDDRTIAKTSNHAAV